MRQTLLYLGHALAKPDLVITDFEPLLPRAARLEGVPYISIDHQHFHKCGEGFVQPESVPPGHGDQVAEPHVRILMGHNIRNAPLLRMRGGALIE